MTTLRRALGLMLIIATISVMAGPAPATVPEIDAGTAGSALALLAGAAFLLRDRLRGY
jgi:hypothetical protein